MRFTRFLAGFVQVLISLLDAGDQVERQFIATANKIAKRHVALKLIRHLPIRNLAFAFDRHRSIDHVLLQEVEHLIDRRLGE